MTPLPEPTEVTLAVVVARLDDMRVDFGELRASVEQSNHAKVHRGEWVERNNHVNSRLEGLGREVGQLRTELASRRAPWWSSASVILAVAALAWSIVGPSVVGR